MQMRSYQAVTPVLATTLNVISQGTKSKNSLPRSLVLLYSYFVALTL